MKSWQYVSLLIFAASFLILYFTIRRQFLSSGKASAKLTYVWYVARFSIIITLVLVLILRATSMV